MIEANTENVIARLDDKEIRPLIEGCLRQDLDSQQRLYKHFYSFAMAKCLRYSNNRYDAGEILNDGFLKAFKNIGKYDYRWPFHAWLGKIMSNTAIDHYRAELKHSHTQELSVAEDFSQDATVHQRINYQDLLKMVQKLPVSYRTVFNLFAIDGYSHEEIGAMLGISVGTSKSNLFKARQKLQKAIKENDLFDAAMESDRENIISMQYVPKVNIAINGGIQP